LGALTPEQDKDIQELVYGFFADECDIPVEDLSDATNVITQLEGDSLMLLALLEKACKRYAIKVPLKVLGKHLMTRPAHTIGDIVQLTRALVEHGDAIVNVAL
jgi:acyl carrier protein